MVRPYSIQRFKGNDNHHESPEEDDRFDGHVWSGFASYSCTFSFQEGYFAESDVKRIEHKATLLTINEFIERCFMKILLSYRNQNTLK